MKYFDLDIYEKIYYLYLKLNPGCLDIDNDIRLVCEILCEDAMEICLKKFCIG